jgi:hypothetical protein
MLGWICGSDSARWPSINLKHWIIEHVNLRKIVENKTV